jgi:aryl-alcohol dehydrogenase-like predicted oxidoreductase/enamine deaminase RidA (YjgF/YER057c/UK114 family)
MKTLIERCELSPGFTISRILTGLWQIADMERDGYSLDLPATAIAMIPYVDAGFTTFDMADHYGSAEEIAGLFFKQHSPNVELLTKWAPTPGPVIKADVRTAVHRSLHRIKTDRLDLLQFHTWNYANPGWLDQLYWLQELKDEGLIRHLGLVNFDTTHLRIVLNSGIDIVSNQVCFSLIDQRAKAGMTELCLQHGIKLLVFGTVAGGFLTEKWLGQSESNINELATWSHMKYKRFIDVAGGWEIFQGLLHTVSRIAKKLGVSIANIACRYILDESAVGGIIIGARLGQSEHIQANLRLFQFSLDEKSRSEITDAITKLLPIPGDCGDEYRIPPFLTAAGDLSHHIESLPPPYKFQTSRNGQSIVLCGNPWDDKTGGHRAIRRGDRIEVTGITPTHSDRLIGGEDVTAQLDFVIDIIEGAIQSLGGQLEDVVRIRVNIRNPSDYEVVTHTLSKRFSNILPENTSIQAALAEFSQDSHLVKMDAEAVVEGG